MKHARDWKDYEGSINDDLEKYFNKYKNQQEFKEELVHSFFTPKLTPEELKLVEEKNKDYMYTFIYGFHADVDIKEMQKSNSKQKYVHTNCIRRTVRLNF